MDLLSAHPFWPLRDGLPATFPPLTETVRCDVAIIGGGISGALTATALSRAGLEVVLVDRREVAHGSTAGNTGLVLYEIDQMLHRLAAEFGIATAQRAYRRCCEAVNELARILRRERIECDFAPRRSLYVAATPAHEARLRREFEARDAAGLAVEWWTRRDLARASSLPHVAAILSRTAAQVDAYRLTYGLLLRAQRRGARVHDRTEVTRWHFRRNGVDLWTSRGVRVRARHLVVSTGYESERFLPRRVGQLFSTYALITEPIPEPAFVGWPADRCMIWDTANPYLYLRTTGDNRAIIGGYDDRFYGAGARDRKLKAKTAALRRRFAQFFPRIPLEIATAWAGTFAVTRDGLPFIGQHPRVPHTWFALGFGGNGITFSIIAAEIIRAALLGDADRDAAIFGFSRPQPR